MKRFLLLLIPCFFSPFLKSQTPFCGNEFAPSDPAAQGLHDQLEQQALDFFSAHAQPVPETGNPVLTIPVVVHIIHDNGTENISDAQVQQGLTWLNAAYANAGYFDQGSGTDVGIQFCLAQRTPEGLATNGITRDQSPLTSMTLETQDAPLKNLNRWAPKQYLNIWLVREICSTSAGCGVVGYAYRPEYHGTTLDGLVIEAQFFGAVESQMSVAAHELGHYLGLYHTFEGGCGNGDCLTQGDRICDTPPDQSTAAVPCGQMVNTCSTDTQSGFTTDQPDMTSNFLDYGNINCFHDFTPGQAARMLFYLNGIRHSLLDSKGCLPPCPTPALSAFSPSATSIVPGQSVTFTNASQNAGVYQWSVNGMAFSTLANPSYTFALPGTYTITLLAQAGNPALCDAASSQAVIQVVCDVVAGFTVSNDNPAENEPVTLTNTSQFATTFSWTVNGVAQGAILPTVTFPAAGVYTIQLTAGSGVCQTSVQQQIFVRDSCVGETFQLQIGNQGAATFSEAYATAVLSDGNIIFVEEMSNTSGQTGLHVAKMDPAGNLLWAKTVDSSAYHFSCHSIAAAPDGGFVLGVNDLEIDSCFVAKFNTNGVPEWMQRFDEVSFGYIEDVKINAAQEIFVLGYAHPAFGAAFYAKMSPTGNLLWSFITMASATGETWKKIDVLPDGGMLAVGNNNVGWGIAERFNASGSLLWRKRMVLNNTGQLQDVKVAGDGTAFLCGIRPDETIWLLKINLDGEILWSKTYEQSGAHTQVQRMIPADGGLTMVGRYGQDIFTGPPVWKGFVVHFDTAGTILWNHNYLQTDWSAFYDLTALPDGGYFGVGAISINEFDPVSTWLLKMDKFGFAGTCTIASATWLTKDSTAYQNSQIFISGPPPYNLLSITLPIMDVSLTPTLLCDKACPTNVEICNNNLDDDGDGLFDCLDPDCPCVADACQPERNNIWYFGNHMGLDFSTEPPHSLNDGMTSNGYISATISDNQGHLLFYTNGWRIYNRFHEVMPQGIHPNALLNGAFTDCLIIPYPGDPAKYYVIINDRNKSFTYSLVDMHLDNGRGDVAPDQHFVSFFPLPKQVLGLTATRSCTFNGYWLATCNFTDNQMLAYRIDQNGLQPTAIISPSGDGSSVYSGQIKFSPNGKQLARTSDGHAVTLYAFDPDITQTGRFVNPQKIQLGQSIAGSQAVEYSPTGRYLYVATYASPHYIYQFDLDAGNAANIAASKVEILSAPSGDFENMQLTPNGKIYVERGFPHQYIDVIHQPDAPGLACQYQKLGLFISASPSADYRGLCNAITSDFRRPHIHFPPDAPDSVCTQNPTTYQIKNVNCDVDSIDWSVIGLNASINTNYQYATVNYLSAGQGQLVITAHTVCGTASDTLPVHAYAPANKILNLGPNRIVCDNGVFTFHAGSGFAKYRWQNGSTDSVLTTLLPGKYWVDVYDACGNRQTDTVTVKIAPASVLALGPDVLQCAGKPAVFQLPAAFTHWQWSPATYLSCDTCTSITADPATSTTWTVLAQTADGCISIDTLEWTLVDTLFFQRDTTVCVGQTLDFYGVKLPADTTAQFFRPSGSPGCDSLVTVQVLGLEPYTGMVQAQICPDQFFAFQGALLPADTTAVFYLPGPGCDSVLTVQVTSFPPIGISLPADSTVLIGTGLTLPAAVSGPGPLSYDWQPGTGLSCKDCLQPEVHPLDTITYTLAVMDGHGCIVRDSITLRVNPDCQLIIPNAFTPNGDGVNDWFYPGADPCVRTVRLWRIVNRWGQVVFERRNFAPNQENLGWDGRWQGQAAASDVLVWMAELEYYDGRIEQRQGELTLLR